MHQTPVKQSFNLERSESEIQQSKQRHSTIFKGSINIDDNARTPRKVNYYVPTADRDIRSWCFKHIKSNRGRIIDWFLQSFSIYNLGWEGYWICIQLIDQLIADYNYITLDNIHIVGVTCVFISSKYANVSPIKLNEVIVQIAHNHFTKTQILKEEEKIFEIIFKHSHIQRHTIYHYLIELNQNSDQQQLCKILRWMAVIWTRINTVLPYLGVRTYKELVQKVVHNLSCSDKEYLINVVRENQKEWEAFSWRKFSNKIKL